MTETQEKPASAGRNLRILDAIVQTKRREVDALRSKSSAIKEQARSAARPRNMRAALTIEGTVSLIAEVKRRSPGAGAIRPDLDPGTLARVYERGGAQAISVLTDREYFHGSLSDLEAVRSAVSLPVLRKDFVLHPLQIWEARAHGADAVLLIVRILGPELLREFRELAEELGMTALVEAHHAEELSLALESGARLVGVNNRDLVSFETDLSTTERLIERVPADVSVISESGIHSGEDVARLGRAGVQGVLVGEYVLRALEPLDAVRSLVGHPSVGRREA